MEGAISLATDRPYGKTRTKLSAIAAVQGSWGEKRTRSIFGNQFGQKAMCGKPYLMSALQPASSRGDAQFGISRRRCHRMEPPRRTRQQQSHAGDINIIIFSG